MKFPTAIILSLGGILGMLLPPLVFLAIGLSEDMAVDAVLSALMSQYSAKVGNLLFSSLFGLLPIVLLTILMAVTTRWTTMNPLRPVLALGGLLPILAVIAWINWDFWRLVLPDMTYPGFPHGLGFVIGPIFFAPIGMLIGLVIVWAVAKLRS